MAAPALNEESVEKRFMSVTNTQDSIQSLSLWILHHKAHCARIVQLWYKAVKKSAKPSHRLTLFYLCNDVVQTCKRKKATVFAEAFKPFIRKATPLVRDASVRAKVERIFNIWEERLVFTQEYIAELKQGLEGKESDDGVFKKPTQRKLKTKEKPKEIEAEKEELFSPSLEEFDAVQPADASLEPPDKEENKSVEEEVDIPTEETLALFKPGEMVEKIRIFMLQASDVDIKVRNLSTLKLDASSIEAIKQLKDRAHGNEFSSQFEESCQRLEEAVKALDKKKGEQKELLDQLRVSEYFYDQQYREARIVANAYKNYGARINTMKRKLEDLSKSLPDPPPPPPPPSETLSSYRSLQPVDMDLDMDNGPPGLDEEDDHIPSPPDEAPSPVGSLADDDLIASESSTSLDNRLANFIPSIHSSTVPVPPPADEMPIPVYVPSSGASMMRRPSTIKTLTESDMPFPEDEGGGTPLTDEQPSTPVQDEEPAISPPPPPPPPPKEKKENPIDFLSRLIAQTQKNKPSGPPSSSSSFLESFSMLTSKVKEHIDSKKMVSEDSSLGDNQAPKSWAAWKAEKAAEVGGMEPPTMLIPPPPMPNFGPIPMPGGLAVSMPPPMPPPVLPPTMSMSIPPPVMTSPPAPFYQHTSPGQKENWPDAERLGMLDSGDGVTSPNIIYPPVQDVPSAAYPPLNSKPGKSILRKSSQSVLKELTRSSEEDGGSLAAMVPPPPPPVDGLGEGSAITTLGTGGSSGEALEFKEKLKRKTSGGTATPPAYTPNPIRPNLMTLTPSGEADMDMDMEEEEEEEGLANEETPRIPVLSSVVRRVDPHEQKLAREKEMQQLRGRDREMDKQAPFFHKERHYGQESSMDEYYPVSSAPSSYNYVDNRAFPAYGAERPPPDPYYQSYPVSTPNFYGPQMPYNNFPFSGPPQHKRPFIQRGGNFRGGNPRNFNHF